MFFIGRRRPGFAGEFVEGLVVDAVIARLRMKDTEWEIYTDVLARFLGVDLVELRARLIEERANCGDLRLCSNRIFFWAYRQAHPW